MNKRIKITLMEHGLIIESEVEQDGLLLALKLAVVMIEQKIKEECEERDEEQVKPETNGRHSDEVH